MYNKGTKEGKGSHMAKQVMVMIVVDDDWTNEELYDQVLDVLVYRHQVAINVEDLEVTAENYDWATAAGLDPEDLVVEG